MLKQMDIRKEDYTSLFEYLKEINEENIDGCFYVYNINELKDQVFNYIMDESNNIGLRESLLLDIKDFIDAGFSKVEAFDKVTKTVIDDLRWRGEGMYHLWGVNFTSEVTVANTIEMFEAETNGFDHHAFLEESNALESIRREILGTEEYIYFIYLTQSNNIEEPLLYIGTVESNTPLSEFDAICRHIGAGVDSDENPLIRNINNYASLELRELAVDHLITFYQKQFRQ